MKYLLIIDGQEHTLAVDRGDELACALDRKTFAVEVAETRPGVYSVLMGGKSLLARVEIPAAPWDGSGAARNGEYAVEVDGVVYRISVEDPRRRRRGGTRLAIEGKQVVKAPMPGKVVRVLVREGQEVGAGQGLVVVEAMKMQNEIKCPKAGKVQKLPVQEGQAVNAGETLAVVE